MESSADEKIVLMPRRKVPKIDLSFLDKIEKQSNVVIAKPSNLK